jgi:putative Holliday junction resolvase
LPFGFDGEETPMFHEARRLARNFALSLEVPVFLQDERATSYEARGRLWQKGHDRRTTSNLVDSEAATIILSDFLGRINE